MTRGELERLLAYEGVDSNAFSIESDRDETLCLVSISTGDFSVFFSERGYRRDERLFATWDSAADTFLKLILSDPTSRVAYRRQHVWPGPPEMRLGSQSDA